jgi:hypothetical protein
MASPLYMIGDNDALDIWSEDSGDTRTIVDASTYQITVASNWIIKNLELRGTNQYPWLSNGKFVRFDNCLWDCQGSTNPYFYGASTAEFLNCAFTKSGAQAKNGVYLGDGMFRFKGCTFDNWQYGLYCAGISVIWLEDCVFGGTSANSSDIYLGHATRWPALVSRNVKLNSATEISVAAGSPGLYYTPGLYLVFEDYDGVKAAWYRKHPLGVEQSFAAASTGAGQRSGGAATVIKCVENNSNVSANGPVLLAEFPVWKDDSSQTIDVWTQHDGVWATVLSTQGSNADLWVECGYYNDANAGRAWGDSRNEASQNTQAEDTWVKIRVTAVDPNATGWVIVRVWAKRWEANKILYVDRIVDVT